MVIVATLENRLPMLLISRPEIKEPQQLRGKVIGINRFGGSNDAAVLDGAESVENGSQRYLHVADRRHVGAHGGADEQARRCDGAVLSGNLSSAQAWHERAGGYRRFRLFHQHVEHRHALLSATKPRRDQRIHQGQIEGMHYVKTNKEGSLKILRKYLQITDTEAVEGHLRVFRQALAALAAHGTGRDQEYFSVDRRRPKKSGRALST